MRYISQTKADQADMLEKIGVGSIEDLFSNVPKSIRRGPVEGLPKVKTEQELKRYFADLARLNRAGDPQTLSFLGAGAYETFIPSVVDHLSGRGEFQTAYTPYQPEISQGTLQSIFEFQSMVASLFGMETANASMYEGASSLAEAILMARRLQRKRRKVGLSLGIHPMYREVVQTYLAHQDVELVDLPLDEAGRTDLSGVDSEFLAVALGQPNFFGVIEDLRDVFASEALSDTLKIAVTNFPQAFAILEAPGELGADIVCGEGQSLGNPVSFSGPYVGLFACRKKFVRQMPGRLVGRCKDADGQDGYVLTLSTREQHIRRDKATSNICTNQSLCALRSAMYMATLGFSGLRKVARHAFEGSQALVTSLTEIKGVSKTYAGPHFHEACLTLPMSAKDFVLSCQSHGVTPGVPVSRFLPQRDKDLLISVTDVHRAEDIERCVQTVKEVLS